CPAARREFRKPERPDGAACRDEKSRRRVRGARAATARSCVVAAPGKRRQSSSPESLRNRFRVESRASGNPFMLSELLKRECEPRHNRSVSIGKQRALTTGGTEVHRRILIPPEPACLSFPEPLPLQPRHSFYFFPQSGTADPSRPWRSPPPIPAPARSRRRAQSPKSRPGHREG